TFRDAPEGYPEGYDVSVRPSTEIARATRVVKVEAAKENILMQDSSYARFNGRPVATRLSLHSIGKSLYCRQIPWS
ncbi:MAG TPA: hypothetical protein VF920_15575, partial [Dongiaceae bacterium]